MILIWRAALTLLLLLACGCSRKSGQAPAPLSPGKSLQSFRLSEDFHVELFAAEPNVMDPVDMAFDENGRIYLAEMIDYPDDPPPGKPHLAVIRGFEPGDDPEQGGFAASRRAEEGDELLRLHGQRNPGQHLGLAVGFADVDELQAGQKCSLGG